jgi:hypothetical protein
MTPNRSKPWLAASICLTAILAGLLITVALEGLRPHALATRLGLEDPTADDEEEQARRVVSASQQIAETEHATRGQARNADRHALQPLKQLRISGGDLERCIRSALEARSRRNRPVPE